MKTRDGEWQLLEISIDRHTARVNLNRPPVNALNQALIAELTAAARSLGKRREVWVVALTASGMTFCAGADLKERAGIPQRQVGSVIKNIQRMVAAWMKVEQPVIAGIQGAALGVAMPDSPKPLLDAARHVANEGLAQFVTDLTAGKWD